MRVLLRWLVEKWSSGKAGKTDETGERIDLFNKNGILTGLAPETKSSMERQELSLNEAATHVLEECRTVVPGMQALFGFQLIAVFSATFEQQLSAAERMLHLAAIVLVTIAIVLVMAPAALHRQTEPMAISQRFIDISSRLLMSSMAPLAFGICLDVYVIARIIAGSRGVAGVIAAFLFGIFLVFWVLMPRAVRRRDADDVHTGSEAAH